jgi:hypothetical protein
MNVINKNGTAARSCKCISWIQHWRKYSRQNAYVCRAKGCSNSDIVGAHVLKDIRNDSKEYIVPFCNKHNSTSGSIELVFGTALATANVSQSCGKKW